MFKTLIVVVCMVVFSIPAFAEGGTGGTPVKLYEQLKEARINGNDSDKVYADGYLSRMTMSILLTMTYMNYASKNKGIKIFCFPETNESVQRLFENAVDKRIALHRKSGDLSIENQDVEAVAVFAFMDSYPCR